MLDELLICNLARSEDRETFKDMGITVIVVTFRESSAI